MAIVRFRRTTYDGGGSAARDRIAYITRQPEYALERGEQHLRYMTDDREDLVYTNSRNLPEWAQGFDNLLPLSTTHSMIPSRL